MRFCMFSMLYLFVLHHLGSFCRCLAVPLSMQPRYQHVFFPSDDQSQEFAQQSAQLNSGWKGFQCPEAAEVAEHFAKFNSGKRCHCGCHWGWLQVTPKIRWIGMDDQEPSGTYGYSFIGVHLLAELKRKKLGFHAVSVNISCFAVLQSGTAATQV